MVDILHKQSSLREATARAKVKVSLPATMEAILNRQVPKGDVFEFSRAAGLLAIKKTSDVIPDCHPLPIEKALIEFQTTDLDIFIDVSVSTIYKTGIEVEAMHGASITALTMYDMLKPIDPAIEISSIKLVEKKGGKSDFKNHMPGREIKTAVIVCSDTVFKGGKSDKSGLILIEELGKNGISHEYYEIIPDEKEEIQRVMKNLAEQQFDLLLFTGGTGLSPRDITPESVQELFTREIPGIMEAARQYGQARTPYAMLSRGVAGMMGSMLVITLPGSSRGAKESMQALFPAIKHIFRVAEGMRHEAS